MSNKRNPALSKQRKIKRGNKRTLRRKWNKFFALMSKTELGMEIWSESIVPLEAFNVKQTEPGSWQAKKKSNWS